MIELAVAIIAAIYAIGAIYFAREYLKEESGMAKDTAFWFCIVFTLASAFVVVITFGG